MLTRPGPRHQHSHDHLLRLYRYALNRYFLSEAYTVYESFWDGVCDIITRHLDNHVDNPNFVEQEKT